MYARKFNQVGAGDVANLNVVLQGHKKKLYLLHLYYRKAYDHKTPQDGD